MSKKKGRGRDLNKVLEILEGAEGHKDPGLIALLKEFHNAPIKRGLQSENIYDDDMAKKVNDALEKGSGFYRAVEDLRNYMDTAKPVKLESRFANTKRVVANYLSLN